MKIPVTKEEKDTLNNPIADARRCADIREHALWRNTSTWNGEWYEI